MSDSQNIPEENNVVQDNTYESLGMWFTVGTDAPLPLRTLLYDMNAEKKGDNKLTDEELEQILSFVEMMSEKAPNIDVEITPLVYFIKHLNRTKDITEPESEEVKKEENEEVLEELSEDESEEVEEEEEDKEEVKEEEKEEEESSEEEEDEEESDTDKQFMYNKDMPTVLISNNHIDIPFPITCTFTVLMTLYSIQLGLLFCRLIGCNYLEHSHDEL